MVPIHEKIIPAKVKLDRLTGKCAEGPLFIFKL
jgi:hypothetical protein